MAFVFVPFQSLWVRTDDRRAFEEHILHTSGPHAKLLAEVAGKYKASLGFDCASARWRASLLSESIAIKERAGLSVTRRTLRNIALNYNDESVQALMCCVCAGSVACIFRGKRGHQVAILTFRSTMVKSISRAQLG